MRKKNFLRFSIFAGIILIIISFNYHLPYYVTKPGKAMELEPIIEVENGYDETGSFMLTTVSMSKADIYSYAIAKFSKYQEIYPLEAIRSDEESEEEYTERQLHMMDGSKTNAIAVAFEKAGLPVEFIFNGVYVTNIISNMPAEGKLKAGDRITAVDGIKFQTTDEFIVYMSEKKPGEKVKISYVREGDSDSVSIPLQVFSENKNKVGIGINLVESKELIVKPKVEIDTAKIGGPSAGFMFSLEIYNQLTKTDLTKGYKIAGTGTISQDGTVGRIGGIEQKIVAADKAGAEIFFAPNEDGAKDSNYKVAVKTAKEIDSKMEIVPVDTFHDAIAYLEKLKKKRS